MNANDYLSKDEIQRLLKKSNVKAALEILDTWFWICIAFAISGIWPNPFTIIVSIWILGGKQLACAIIMHDTSHHAQFETKRANEIFGNLFGGFPIFLDVARYRPYHLSHHSHTGKDNDPDIDLTKGYPAGTKSLIRKIARDLTGLTGLKILVALVMIQSELWRFNLGGRVERISKSERKGLWHIFLFFKNMAGPIVVNTLMWFALWSTGNGWLYLLWIVAYFTTYQFCLRIRSIAEHSVVPDRTDNHLNTRTTYANFIEKMLSAPHHVNYHAEHHLLMTVPSYNLPKMHRLLKARGYFDKGLLKPNYLEIIKLAA
ncbi:MAG: fatty acid desaturase family protein [Flavobacteriales bacterium]|nr:fatty acid desaturase family protein [Flavobacteriales bacterium]